MWRIIEIDLDGGIKEAVAEKFKRPSWIHDVMDEPGYEHLVDLPDLKVSFWLESVYVISVKEE